MTAGVVALASIYGAVAPALAEKLRRTSVEEYDAKSYEDKADTLSTAVNFFYRHQDPAKGECIARLFTRTVPDFSVPKGYIELDEHDARRHRRLPQGQHRPRYSDT